MKIYVTKYFLTSGIKEIEAEPEGNMVRFNAYTWLHGEGNDWHRSRFSAVARAKHLVEAKKASLKEQLTRLEKMVIE